MIFGLLWAALGWLGVYDLFSLFITIYIFSSKTPPTANQVRLRDTSSLKLLDISGDKTFPALELLDTSGPNVLGQVRPQDMSGPETSLVLRQVQPFFEIITQMALLQSER